MSNLRTRLATRLKAVVVTVSVAGLATAALAGPGSMTALATGAEGFLFIQPGFTQTLWGTHPSFLGGVAFATNGDVLTDHCSFGGSPLVDYSQTSTTSLNGSTLHNHSELTSNAGCGLANHPDGTLYTNTGGGVVNLNAATGAFIRGPFGHAGNALGIATDPQTGNLVYVGDGDTGYNLYFVNSSFTSSGTFSTADPGDFKDQISWSPDGNFLFVSNRAFPHKLEILNRSGGLVQNAIMSSEPDGIAFHASAPQFVLTNNTDGSMTRFDFPANDYTLPPTQTVFASGGFRGDMSAVAGDGCLYITQSGTRYANGVVTGENSILQICGGFAPTAGDAAISATGTTFSATEGQPQTATVATVTDGDANDTAAEYSATINWGDGSTSAGAVTGPNGGPYSVTGTHTYQEEGSHPVMVHIMDSDSTNTADATSTANVGDAALTSSCATPPASAQTFNGPTATFTDANAFATSADFTATINWGDGSSSAGTVSGGPGVGPYTVTGSHTYSSTGPFTITTTINDDGGSTTTATCGAVVGAFPTSNGGTFVVGDLEAMAPPMIGNSLTWWGSKWAKINDMSGGSGPMSFKGFAEGAPSPLPDVTKLCGMTWTTDPGNSAPPPSTVPAHMFVFVSSHIVKNGSVISGDIREVIVVKTNPGYAPNPGHPGTGTEEAIVCTS